MQFWYAIQTHSLINGKFGCEIRTRTTHPGARSSSQVTNRKHSHRTSMQTLSSSYSSILKPLQSLHIKYRKLRGDYYVCHT